MLAGRHALTKTPGLPNPNDEKSEETAVAFASANAEVDQENDEQEKAIQSCKRKRGPYHADNGKLRLKMARSVDAIGLKATATTFTAELDHELSMNTLKSMQQLYWEEIKHTGDPRKMKRSSAQETSQNGEPSKGLKIDQPMLPDRIKAQAQGRPMVLPGCIEFQALPYVQVTRECGGIMNRRLLCASTVEVVKATQPSLLRQHKGSLDFGDS